MEDHPREIQTVWICKPNENGNPPEITQTRDEAHTTRNLQAQVIIAGGGETLKEPLLDTHSLKFGKAMSPCTSLPFTPILSQSHSDSPLEAKYLQGWRSQSLW